MRIGERAPGETDAPSHINLNLPEEMISDLISSSPGAEIQTAAHGIASLQRVFCSPHGGICVTAACKYRIQPSRHSRRKLPGLIYDV